MSQERLTRSDVRIITVALLLGALGVGVALRYYRKAFPEASIDFKVSRSVIERRARELLEQRGFDLAAYHQTTLFKYDETAKTYLERELGLEEANRLMASELNVWRWKVRLFKPPEKEELIAWLDPGGQIVGFEHIIEEKTAGASLEKLQAQSVAEVFLHSQLGLNLSDYALVEDKLVQRPNRLDYDFTWERQNFKAKDATYRISASVYGDQVGKVLPSLKVPEQWQRDYERLRSRNSLLELIATLFYVPLLIAVLFVLIPRLRQRRIKWKPLLWLGGILGVLMTLSLINGIPLASDDFSTAAPYPIFVVIFLIGSVIVGMLMTIFLVILAGGGDALYRDFAPGKVALTKLFTIPGLRTKEFFTATVVGYSLAAIQIGFVVVFYLVARRFGAWSPADVKYDDILNTSLPWIYPLTIGLFAATTEEFSFRMFAIPFLKKYLKSTWLAVLIPAFVWGFLHSGYPQQPAWIRGVEVGIVGVVFGFVMLRFGILATLVAHYTYDAVLVSLLLLRSGNFYFLFTGGLVMDAALIPIAVAGALYWQHRRFAAERELFNAGAEPTAVVADLPSELAEAPPVAAPQEALYASLTSKKLWAAAAAFALGLLLWWVLPVERPLDSLRWQTSANDAAGAADRFLSEKGVNPTEWQRVTKVENHFQVYPRESEYSAAEAAEYVRRLGGIKFINELWSNRLALDAPNWRVRYFRPLQKEEHQVYVTSDGRIARHEHLLDETGPGANLTESEAKRRASDYLAKAYQLNVSDWRVAESKLEKREARTDHHLAWEDTTPVVGNAQLRAEVDVRGDEAGNYRPSLKVPDEWLRELKKPRIQNTIASAGIVLITVWVLVVGVRWLRQHTFRWRLYLAAGLLVTGLSLLTRINALSTLGYDYDTSTPWSTYLFKEIAVGIVLGTIGLGLLGVLLALAADVFYAGKVPTASFLPLAQTDRLVYYRDALLTGIGVGFFLRGVTAFYQHFGERFPTEHRATTLSFGASLDALIPGVSGGIQAVLGALLSLALVAIVVGLWERHLSSSVSKFSAVLLLVLLPSMLGSMGIGDFFQAAGQGLLRFLLLAAAIRYFLRRNLLAYLVMFTVPSVIAAALYYWQQQAAVIRWSAIIAPLIALAFLALLVPVVRRVVKQRAADAGAASGTIPGL